MVFKEKPLHYDPSLTNAYRIIASLTRLLFHISNYLSGVISHG